MKIKTILISLISLNLAFLGNAQQTNQLELLKKQLQKIQEDFERIQREQLRQIQELKEQIEALERGQTGALKTNILSQPVAEKTDWRKEVAGATAQNVESKKFSPTAPIYLFSRGNNYLDISVDALMSAGSSTARDIEDLQPGGHDPSQRGFTLQQLELVLSGAVDPYLRGQAQVVYQLDSSGESNLELEEVYAETTSLPGYLQLKAGQFYTEFGRLNTRHPHEWSFVDIPLVNARLLGADGLRNPGIRISWLMPLPFYSELFFTIQNSGGSATSFRGSGHHHNDHSDSDLVFGRPVSETSIRNIGDLLFTPRYLASFDLTDTQTLSVGASAAFGPNSTGSDTRTEIYGADLFWKWKPKSHHGGFPFVSFQSEFMLRKYTAAEAFWDFDSDGIDDYFPKERLTDYGFYAQIDWGIRKGWVASLRGEYVTGDSSYYEQILGVDPDRITRKRISPALSWYITEFSKLRLQYNYDHREGIGSDHSVWMQLEFVLGQHAAHKF